MLSVWLRRSVIGMAFLSCGVSPVVAQTVVRLASAQNSIGSLPIVLAQREGLFAAENLKIDIVDFRGGAPAVQALASGSVEACICAADHAVRLRARGQGGVVLVALTEFHGYGLVALTKSPATDLKSLQGKRIGITTAGSLTDNTLRYFLEQAGMNPDRDVEITGVGTGGPMRAAIETGSVAAGMLTTPDVQAALAEPEKFKLVQDYRNLQYPALGLLALEKWIKPNEATARALARAVVKAEAMVRVNRPAVEAALAEMYPALAPKLRAVLADEAPRLLSADGRMDPAGYKLMQGMLKVSDPTLVPASYEQVSALSYLPQP
ncbi:MAG: ABC transporter substrate-binding protein [Beijerinckiaceae bacterium]|nr:ABC transporter substrate-binding protein [Beijerinckiaceae bacterium]